MKKSSKVSALWQRIGSVRLALILLWMIIVVSFIGALLPAEQQPLIYANLWFYALLGCFALNLTVCCLCRIFGKRAKAGSIITHVAVLVILAGSLVSVLLGFRGHLELEEGQIRDSFTDNAGVERKLPFRLLLEDFSLQWYEQVQKGFPVRVRVEDSGFKGSFLAQKGKEYPLAQTGYSFSIGEYLPDFVFDQDHKALSRSNQPLNPALLIHIKTPASSEDRWLFSLHPDIEMAKDTNIRFRFDLEPQIKEFRSKVAVIDDLRKAAFTRYIKVNIPLEYRGYSFYQARYDSQTLQWTGLDVVHDPGVGIVFLGFILLNLGIVMIVYPKLKASFAAGHIEKK
jgi:cytochrome c biogenesis protein ResB